MEACLGGSISVASNCLSGVFSFTKAYFDCFGCGVGSLVACGGVSYVIGPRRVLRAATSTAVQAWNEGDMGIQSWLAPEKCIQGQMQRTINKQKLKGEINFFVKIVLLDNGAETRKYYFRESCGSPCIQVSPVGGTLSREGECSLRFNLSPDEARSKLRSIENSSVMLIWTRVLSPKGHRSVSQSIYWTALLLFVCCTRKALAVRGSPMLWGTGKVVSWSLPTTSFAIPMVKLLIWRAFLLYAGKHLSFSLFLAASLLMSLRNVTWVLTWLQFQWAKISFLVLVCDPIMPRTPTQVAETFLPLVGSTMTTGCSTRVVTLWATKERSFLARVLSPRFLVSFCTTWTQRCPSVAHLFSRKTTTSGPSLACIWERCQRSKDLTLQTWVPVRLASWTCGFVVDSSMVCVVRWSFMIKESSTKLRNECRFLTSTRDLGFWTRPAKQRSLANPSTTEIKASAATERPRNIHMASIAILETRAKRGKCAWAQTTMTDSSKWFAIWKSAQSWPSVCKSRWIVWANWRTTIDPRSLRWQWARCRRTWTSAWWLCAEAWVRSSATAQAQRWPWSHESQVERPCLVRDDWWGWWWWTSRHICLFWSWNE